MEVLNFAMKMRQLVHLTLSYTGAYLGLGRLGRFEGVASKLSKLLITTTPFHSLFFLFFLLALQPPMGVVFYSPLVGFSLLAYEVS